MPTRSKLLSLVLAALMVFAFTPAVEAQFTSAIYAVDQDVVDGVVRVTRVTSDGPGWAVVHADDAGAPGPVIGYAAVANGISANVDVQVDSAAITPVIYAMLHEDSGTEGTFEFPDGDAPVQVDDAVVMAPINVTATGESLAAVVAGQEELSTLFAAIEAAGVAGDFTADGGPYTVFAPSNDAFAALPEGELDALLADPEALGGVLAYHLLPGVVTSDLITESIEAETINGAPVAIEVADGAITVNGANVTTADLEAYNGVVHIIDAVLLPPAAEEAAAEEAPAEEAAAEPPNLVDAAIAAGNFNTLVAAVQAAGMENTLRNGSYTVFAPTDEAFAALPAGTVEALLADRTSLRAVLYNHISGDVRGTDAFVEGAELRTPRGQTLTVTPVDGGFKVGDANIVTPDIPALNGVIHAIDSVLLPEGFAPAAAEEAAAEATAEPTEEAAEEAAAEATPEPTEAAAEEAVAEATAEPTEEAAEEAVAEATPEPTEEAAEEAVAEATAEPTEEAAEEAAAAPADLPATGAAKQTMADIVDTAIGAGNFSTLVEYVQAAGLEDALRGEGPFTVFAPTNDAFAALPAETVAALQADPEGLLKNTLLYHVLGGAKVMSADVTDGLTATTLEGSDVSFSVADGVVKINDANITVTDIEATNGVIHVIDAVITPPTEEAAAEEAVVEATAAPTEEAAEEVAEVVVEATPVPVEEAAAEGAEEAAAAEATAEPTEEAAEEVVVEATPVPVEEAAAEGVVEATAEPAEEVAEVAAEATAAPAEEVVEEEAPAPEAMPATGGSLNGSVTTFAAVVMVLLALAGAAFVTRRRQA